MANIALVTNSKSESLSQSADSLREWLVGQGHNVYMKVLKDMPFIEGGHILDGKRGKIERDTKEEIDVKKLDLAISLGGDGAILHTVEAVSDEGIPVLGVNYGQLGYLAEVDPQNTQKVVESFLGGDYEFEERMRLSTDFIPSDISSSNPTHIANALNEVFLGKIQSGHTIRLAIYIGENTEPKGTNKTSTDEKPFLTYQADGLIIATPTGSTAYSLSAGGPILEPDLEAIVITPVAPHMIFDRSLVISAASRLRVEVIGDYSAEFSIDGYSYGEIKPSESVAITQADKPAKLISYKPRDFHKVLKSKFGLKDR